MGVHYTRWVSPPKFDMMSHYEVLKVSSEPSPAGGKEEAEKAKKGEKP